MNSFTASNAAYPAGWHGIDGLGADPRIFCCRTERAGVLADSRFWQPPEAEDIIANCKADGSRLTSAAFHTEFGHKCPTEAALSKMCAEPDLW